MIVKLYKNYYIFANYYKLQFEITMCLPSHLFNLKKANHRFKIENIIFNTVPGDKIAV